MTLLEEIWNDPLYRLVVWICIWQAVGLVALAGVIWAIRVRRHRRRWVSEQAMSDISSALFEYLAGNQTVEAFVARTERYTIQQLARVLETYLATLSGESAGALDRFFAKSGMERRARRMCRSIFWWTRLEGARILGAGGSRVGAASLLDLLDDRHPAVRLAAARSLGQSEDPRYIEPLLRALRRGHLSRAQIAEVLVRMGPVARQRLRELVMQLPPDRSASTLRATTVEVLALVGDSGATPFIQYALASGDAEVRIAAFKAASVLRVALNVDEMRSGIEDPVWQVRAQAATAVGRCAMYKLIPELGGLLGDRNWWVRVNAARALYELGAAGHDMLESVAATHSDAFARGMALRVLTEDPAYGALMSLRERISSDAVPTVGAAEGSA